MPLITILFGILAIPGLLLVLHIIRCLYIDSDFAANRRLRKLHPHVSLQSLHSQLNACAKQIGEDRVNIAMLRKDFADSRERAGENWQLQAEKDCALRDEHSKLATLAFNLQQAVHKLQNPPKDLVRPAKAKKS